jgi:hypothetical protein
VTHWRERMRLHERPPRVENINWHFEHDHEWSVTYAREVVPGLITCLAWAYGWSQGPHKPLAWELLRWS